MWYKRNKICITEYSLF